MKIQQRLLPARSEGPAFVCINKAGASLHSVEKPHSSVWKLQNSCHPERSEDSLFVCKLFSSEGMQGEPFSF
jgi:hypothetical protein